MTNLFNLEKPAPDPDKRLDPAKSVGVPEKKSPGINRQVIAGFPASINVADESFANFATRRSARIAFLKLQILDGNYHPDPAPVAESLLKFIMQDH